MGRREQQRVKEGLFVGLTLRVKTANEKLQEEAAKIIQKHLKLGETIEFEGGGKTDMRLDRMHLTI